MQNVSQGIKRWEEVEYKGIDSAGEFTIKRDKFGKLRTSRDVILRGGPEELNGRVLGGIVGDLLKFPQIDLVYKNVGEHDKKGRNIFKLI
jgi:hypothetical protein